MFFGRQAFALSCLLHLAAGTLLVLAARRCTEARWLSMGPKSANVNIMQIELQSVEASPARPEVPPEAAPPSAPAKVPVEEVQKPPASAPNPEPVAEKPAEVNESQGTAKAQTAQVAQPSSAPVAQVAAAEPLAGSGRSGEVNWQSAAIAKLRALVEREKYYPAAARKAGYTGRVSVRIRLEPDGSVSSYEIKESRGHPMLGRAVETTMGKIKGRNIGLALPEQFDVLLPIEFELN